ncbi:peptidoglycan-N-acetylmuramate O-acetyltransferase [Alicyclobacillus sacchari]|uniref:Peptidoglycan-N-acetylmuramate O-acetyltransferase n=1 Tax=Alicyclobacillus sacchari TaxID=392010 RepID=A0A4R8LHC9_9BACL|nr:acyltransferase family protein [Alicyclobacillus sacchari]TDY42591.1 peptidoglycan-N-acetylmuramate O-acetyltransferase [Alicyclobacillus sacchari]
MPKPMGGNGRYMPGLDGLRALAVLAVIAYHLNLSWAPGGLLGVQVFFVLSGYLITDLLIAQWKRNGRILLGDFWLRRARRLLPAMFSMLVAVMAWVWFEDRTQFTQFRQDAIASICYVSNWWFIFHKVSYFASFGRQTPLGHLWSLAVEEQFYLIWPLVLILGLRFLRRRGSMLIATLALALVSALWMGILYQPGLDPSRVYYGTDTRAFGLLIGASVAFVWPSSQFSRGLTVSVRRWLDVVGFLALLCILWMIWQTNEYENFLYRGGLFLLSIATAVLVACLAHPDTRLGRLFGMQPLRWLGVRSYGIYLWHFPIIVLTTPLMDANQFNGGRAAAQVLASIVIAALSWRLLEEPIRRLGRRKHVGAPDRTVRVRRRHPGRWAFAGSAAAVVVLFCAGMTAYAPTVVATLGNDVRELDHQGGPQTDTDGTHPVKSTVGNGASGSGKAINRAPHSSTGAGTAIEKTTVDTTGHEKAQPISAKAPKTESGVGVSAIGDSVMVDATPYLQKLLPGIVCDGMVGRQMYQAPEAVAQLKAKGELGDIVIIELGTNGPFSKSQLVSLLQSLGPVKRIILVNTRVPRPWQNVVNQTLAQVAQTFPHTELVDWYQASAGHSAYFYEDGVHLNPQGAAFYASLLAKAVEQ